MSQVVRAPAAMVGGGGALETHMTPAAFSRYTRCPRRSSMSQVGVTPMQGRQVQACRVVLPAVIVNLTP